MFTGGLIFVSNCRGTYRSANQLSKRPPVQAIGILAFQGGNSAEKGASVVLHFVRSKATHKEQNVEKRVAGQRYFSCFHPDKHAQIHSWLGRLQRNLRQGIMYGCCELHG